MANGKIDVSGRIGFGTSVRQDEICAKYWQNNEKGEGLKKVYTLKSTPSVNTGITFGATANKHCSCGGDLYLSADGVIGDKGIQGNVKLGFGGKFDNDITMESYVRAEYNEKYKTTSRNYNIEPEIKGNNVHYCEYKQPVEYKLQEKEIVFGFNIGKKWNKGDVKVGLEIGGLTSNAPFVEDAKSVWTDDAEKTLMHQKISVEPTWFNSPVATPTISGSYNLSKNLTIGGNLNIHEANLGLTYHINQK